MNETVRQLALGLDTPPDERFDASVEMHKAYRPLASQLIPPENLRPVIDYINNGLMDAEFYKATRGKSSGWATATIRAAACGQ